MELKSPGKLHTTIEKHYLRIGRALFRIKMKITGDSRPGSYPYVSGDTFRKLADHIHDETGSFDPIKVGLGDIVFVSSPLVLEYMQTLHPRIKNPYILIAHNGDNSIGKPVIDLIDEKIIRFYAQHVLTNDIKIIPLDIGIENAHYHTNGIPRIYTQLIKKTGGTGTVRKNRIFFQFSVETNPTERGPAKQYFLTHPLMDTLVNRIPSSRHAKILSTYKFMVSPPGNGIGCSRTWEALYMKTIPVVKDSVTVRYMASLGLPIWIVKDWHELDGLTEADLARKYDTLMSTASFKPLHMNFWIEKIHEDQRQARKHNEK